MHLTRKDSEESFTNRPMNLFLIEWPKENIKESMYGQNCGLSMLTHDHNLNLAQNERKRIEFFTTTVF